MPDILVFRHNFETLAAAPPFAKTTRFASEVVHDISPDPAAALEVARLSFEVLANVPPQASTTRFVTEVLHDIQPDSAAALAVARLNLEVLGALPPLVATTRFVTEVLHDIQPDPAGAMEVARVNFEVLARRFIQLQACPVPAFWRLFAHNWISSFKLETRYKTAISRGANSLSEDRTQLWERPRRTLKIRWSEKGLANKQNLMDLIQTIREFKTNDWMVPLAPYETCLVTGGLLGAGVINADFTKGPFFKGGRVAIIKTLGDRGDVQTAEGVLAGVHLTTLGLRLSDTQFEIIDTLPFDVFANTSYIVPLVCVHPRLLDTIKQHHHRLWDLTLEFEEVGGPTAIPPSATDLPPNFDVYRNIPILRPRHDYTNPLNIEILQEGEQIDIGRGKGTFFRGATQRIKHRIKMLEEHAIGWDYIRFFDTRRGRLRAFWMIDQENLFEIVDVEAAFIDVQKLGDFTAFQKDLQFFGFMMKDGTCFVREIVTIDDLSSWRLTVVDVLPTGLVVTDIVLAGRARPTRMIEDTLDERWHHTGALQLEVRTISLLEEKDVTLDP